MHVELATSEEQRGRIFAFRYRIYVVEMGLQPADADHDRGWLRDALDDHSLLHALLDGDQVVGTLRTTPLVSLPDPAPLIDRFSLAPALAAFGPEAICATGRFMLEPAVRHGASILRLMRRAFEDAQARQLRLNYGDCSPHLLPFYEHLGFRRYTRAFNDSGYGFKVPILMLVGDRRHFERVRSPLGRAAADQPDDAAARDWFERSYAAEARVETATLLPEGEFLDLLAERIAGDPLHGVALFHGLSREEADRFLAKATIVRAAPGDRVVRQGDFDTTMFVLLSGIAEVTLDRDASRPVALLGAGDPFGEMSFLRGAQRSASVVAQTQCEFVVLTAEFLSHLLSREATLAAKVLLNLSRILAGRLAEMNRTAVVAAQARAAASPGS